MIAIVSPTQNESVKPVTSNQPIPLPVQGGVTCGTPQQEDIPVVTVQVDQQPAVSATVNLPPQLIPVKNEYFATYVSTVSVPDVTGSHVITATAAYKFGPPSKAEVTVIVGPGGVTNAFLTGTCTAKSALTLSSSDLIGLRFTAPSEVEITSFPPITFPTVAFAAGVSLDVTMSLNSSGTGTFDSSTGIISIPGVVLSVSATISVPVPVIGTITRSATGTFTTTLTTEMTTSPEVPPVLTDSGGRLQPSGQVLLVGDGMYSTPVFGMTDGGIALAGVISPHP